MDFRSLTSRERQSLEKMLSVDFPGCQALAAQIANLYIRQHSETFFEFTLSEQQSNSARGKTFGVPSEATYLDKDGKEVFAWLFVDEKNFLTELEIWRPDGKSISTYFADANLSVRLIKKIPNL